MMESPRATTTAAPGTPGFANSENSLSTCTLGGRVAGLRNDCARTGLAFTGIARASTSANAPRRRACSCRNAALKKLLFRQTVKRRRAHAEHREHEVELSAMMNLVLDHRAKPLPRRDARPRWCRAPAVERLRRERAIDVQRFRVRAVEVRDDRVVSVGQVASMPRIRARVTSRGLGEHVPLGRTNVPHQPTERECTIAMRPLDLVTRDGLGNSTRAPAHAVDIRQETVNT